jgi:hypothetical protein
MPQLMPVKSVRTGRVWLESELTSELLVIWDHPPEATIRSAILNSRARA